MKRISRIFMGGAFTIILITAACAPTAGQGALNVPGPLLQDDMTDTPTAVATDTTGTAETSTATAVDTTLTPSTPGTGPEVISLDCQYCVDTVAHAQLLIPRNATLEVISPPELADTDDDENGDDDDDNGEGRRLRAQLSGAAEVPGPGDPDGSGMARITLRPEEGEACFELTVSNIEPATAAHIHEGAEGVAGPVVIPLDPAATEGSSSGCVGGVDTALLRNILQNPRQYYVNVHNEEFPDGAVRGQLARVDDDDNGDDDDDNGDRMGCRTIDRFRDTKLVLCRAEENTTITLNVCQDDACTEVQFTLQSCTLATGTPSPITTTTATATVTLVPMTPTAALTFTPVAPATETPTPTVATDTPTASATSTPTATSTSTSTPTP